MSPNVIDALTPLWMWLCTHKSETCVETTMDLQDLATPVCVRSEFVRSRTSSLMKRKKHRT